MSMSIRRVVGATAAVGLAVVGLQVTGMGTALAHTATLSGTAQCAQNGTYTVSWTVTNSNTPDEESAALSNVVPGGSSIGSNSLTIPHDSSKTVTQTGIPGTATSAGLTLTATWPNFSQPAVSKTVQLDGTCGAKTVKTATAPTAKNGACVNYAVTKPAIVIPNQSGVRYQLDGKSVDAGTLTVSVGKHLVSATSTVWKLTGQTSWSYVLTSAAGNCSPPSATPVSPDVSQAVCTGTGPSAPTLSIPTTKGIDYDVSKKGPYTPGESVKVTATATKNYQLGSLPSGWKKSGDDSATRTVRFDDAPVCRGFADESDTNSPAAGVAAGSNGGLAATGDHDFGPLAALALVMLATGMVLVRRTRRA